MVEAGVNNVAISAWFGLMAPGTTPPPLVRKIAADVARIVATAELQNRILADASEPVGSSPDDYAAFIRSEIVKWREVVRQTNMKPE